jgi:hypothetical protein
MKIASPIEEVADIEFRDLGDRGDRRDGLEVDAVAGVDFEPKRTAPDLAHLLQRNKDRCCFLGIAVIARASQYAPV